MAANPSVSKVVPMMATRCRTSRVAGGMPPIMLTSTSRTQSGSWAARRASSETANGMPAASASICSTRVLVGIGNVAGDERGGGGPVERRELEVDGVVAGHQAVPGFREGRCVWRWAMADGDDDALVEAGAGQVVQQAQAGVVGVVDVVDDQEHTVGGGGEAKQFGGGDEQSLVSGLASPAGVGAGERPVDLLAVGVGETVEEGGMAAAQVGERFDDRRIRPCSFDGRGRAVASTPAAPHRRGA